MKHALMITGTHSGVGKTTISIALMAALRRRGLTVQGFKVGPDFIDTGFHAAATGRASHNLDGWMLAPDTNQLIFARATAEADAAVIEGMMGLFDGASGNNESGSTAEMAKLLKVPVVLVIDATAQARSAAALVHGFETFDADLPVSAVISNYAAGEGHYRYIQDSINTYCRAEPIGWLARNPAVALPSRHLGLVTSAEVMEESQLAILADWIEDGIDLDRLLSLSAINDRAATGQAGTEKAVEDGNSPTEMPVRIGIARDRAFCFYYESNLELLKSMGADLIYWSPMNEPLPDGLHGLYFGGGYPELYAPQLSDNFAARCAVNSFVAAGGAVYAECGGLMYLTEAILDTEGTEHPMTGVFPTKARMHRQLRAIGYAEVEAITETSNTLLAAGETVRGHQFRYSEIDPMPAAVARSYRIKARRPSDASNLEGYIINNCLASYIHLHFLSNPGFIARWLENCLRSNVTTQAQLSESELCGK